jgi:hypothetical protein
MKTVKQTRVKSPTRKPDVWGTRLVPIDPVGQLKL